MRMTIFISLEESMMYQCCRTSAFNGWDGRSSGFHQSVAECAVIGINDALRGQIPLALVVTKIHDEIEHFQLEHEIIHMIRQQIGAVASLRNVVIVNRLPKPVQVKFFENWCEASQTGNSFKSVDNRWWNYWWN
jgi:acyl-CoA synthetase (AMP-forming)/AMP-acid ligase II